MKKSRTITLTLMTGLAAACSDGRARDGVATGEYSAFADSVRYCVDSANRVVSDAECTRPRTGGGFYPYFFYFGGRTAMLGGNTYVSGGTRAAPGATIPTRAPVSRGGFGATGAGRTGSFGG